MSVKVTEIIGEPNGKFYIKQDFYLYFILLIRFKAYCILENVGKCSSVYIAFEPGNCATASNVIFGIFEEAVENKFSECIDRADCLVHLGKGRSLAALLCDTSAS
ncbi:hypothetical protein HELRODRAFT_177561 [Helobdella robusta]|uniref:Uncharacterized protein n=1 Tax=Helobdella robusta TaxID=6412 RepID=T1FBV8_HELRO|nr:hypothetical protein HELRODRAFT_177561 [Helobdella robusta]ESN97906.1 hypothetical protein HELRODRAFT_177561 [Helobdella robusta]